MEKMAWDGPKWGREDFFPADPGLANILGRTDLDFENFYFFHFLDPKFLDFQVPRFPKSGLGRAAATTLNFADHVLANFQGHHPLIMKEVASYEEDKYMVHLFPLALSTVP